MSSVYQKVISIISKPIENREDDEINSILVWFTNLFRKKASVFGDISEEIIRDIIKNCNFETKKRDELIIRQGDKGDCFYVNLRGKVSIYINHKQHDVFDSIDDNGVTNDEDNETKNIRDLLGNYVCSLNAGEGFGEVALVSDADRTASIIADEISDLMVVNKALYRRCLQAPALRKLAEKQNFIDRSPFFGNWSHKMKKLLSLCLEREIVRYDSYLGKQGELADKIYFIIKGEAKVTVDPTNHITQYPKLYPLKLPENEGQEIISTWIEEKNKNHNKDSMNGANKLDNQITRKNSQAIVRRSFTFAEAEQRRKIKNIEVGILGGGEISGLCEIVMDMPSYMQSTKCIEDCDVFYIYKRSYERLIAKRNPTCINKMMEYVYLKLQARNNRLKLTNPITFYRSLEYRLELLIHGRKKTFYSNQNNNNNNNINNNINTSNSLKLPPRGPIIQMDSKPKPKIKDNKKNRININGSQLSNNTINSTINKIDTDESLNSTNEFIEEINLNEQQQQQQQQQSQSINNNNNNNNQNKQKKSSSDKFDIESTNDQALNDLEVRIKQWHLQNGCKNPLFETFHRVDADKIKNNIKPGGKIIIKNNKINIINNNELSHHRNSASGSSGFSSGNSNDSDDDLFPNELSIPSKYQTRPRFKIPVGKYILKKNI